MNVILACHLEDSKSHLPKLVVNEVSNWLYMTVMYGKLGLGYTRDWLPADSFVARAWAMVLNGRAHTVRHVRSKTILSSSSADSHRQLCVRTVGRLEK
jgi:hypothetical protein